MAIYCKLGVVRDGLFVAFVVVWAITRMTFFPLWYATLCTTLIASNTHTCNFFMTIAVIETCL